MNKLDLAIEAVKTGMPNSFWRAETLQTLEAAKAIIDTLLDAAQHGADDFLSLAEECAADDEEDAAEDYAERASHADHAIKEAHTLLEDIDQ